MYKTILQKYNKTVKYFIGFSNTRITHRAEDLPATVEMKNSNKIAVPLISTYIPVFHDFVLCTSIYRISLIFQLIHSFNDEVFMNSLGVRKLI